MPAGFWLVSLADPANLSFYPNVIALCGREGPSERQGYELYGRELPRFENSRNVEMRVLRHLLDYLTLRLQL